MIQQSHKKIEDMILSTQDRTPAVNMVTPNIEKGSGVQQVSTSVIFAKRLVISVACATRRKINIITRRPMVHPRHIKGSLNQCMLKIL